MKTNRMFWLPRLAIVAGTIWISTQAPALAETAPVTAAAPQQLGTRVKAPEQPRIILASAACTRVGNRMVC